MRDAYLVYQCGIANIFDEDPGEGELRRRFQGAFETAHAIAIGLKMAGVRVHTYHCDEAGDIIHRDWTEGPGDMFADSKLPI